MMNRRMIARGDDQLRIFRYFIAQLFCKVQLNCRCISKFGKIVQSCPKQHPAAPGNVPDKLHERDDPTLRDHVGIMPTISRHLPSKFEVSLTFLPFRNNYNGW